MASGDIAEPLWVCTNLILSTGGSGQIALPRYSTLAAEPNRILAQSYWRSGSGQATKKTLKSETTPELGSRILDGVTEPTSSEQRHVSTPKKQFGIP
jgi:hypothetical protein